MSWYVRAASPSQDRLFTPMPGVNEKVFQDGAPDMEFSLPSQHMGLPKGSSLSSGFLKKCGSLCLGWRLAVVSGKLQMVLLPGVGGDVLRTLAQRTPFFRSS